MPETPLILYIDLQQGSRIDLEAAANASLAWTRTIKSIGRQIDPFFDWSVQLESTLPGSQKIKSYIVLPEKAELRGMIKGAIAVCLLFSFKVIAAWTIEQVLEFINGPDAPEEVKALSKEDVKELAAEIVVLLNHGVGAKESTQVFEALEEDRHVTGVGVSSKHENRPSRMISRSEFPDRNNLDKDNEAESRVVSERIDLTLIRPILTSESSRRWGFQSRYGVFGAPIHDQDFLDALASGSLNIPMAEGIRMIVDIEITEHKEGDLWRPVERVIKKVVEVIPPAMQSRMELDGPQ